MDIYILRDGQQTGPFSGGAVQALLESGETTLDDFAWRDGLPTWQPLHAVLYPKSATQKILPPPPKDAPTPTPEPFLSPAAKKPEPASARQKAYLSFLGITFSGDLTKEGAAVLLNDAAEDQKHAARIKRWETEKLRLHPELFAEEIQARKENRSLHFLEVCNKEGAEFFHDVSRAHTQVLVTYLDVQHPNWDEHPDATQYLFAALAEKFPQLVKGSAKGQLKYPDGPKVATEMERSGVGARPRRKRSPIAAALRGIALGVLVLAALYGAHAFYERHIAHIDEPGTAEAEQPDVPLPTPPNAVVKVKPKAKRKDAATVATTKAEPAAEIPAAPTPVPTAPVVVLAAGTTPPTTEAPAAVPMTEGAPPTPAPAPAPAAIPSLLEPAAMPATATPAPRTSVKITKATTVVLRFGTSTLAAGTVVPIVSADAANVTIRFGPDVIAVPVANTDFNSTP